MDTGGIKFGLTIISLVLINYSGSRLKLWVADDPLKKVWEIERYVNYIGFASFFMGAFVAYWVDILFK